MRAFILSTVSLLAASQLCGCGNDAPVKYEVWGTVTLDGDPIASGDVYFESVDGSATEAGQIKDGDFTFMAQPGPKVVSIQASKKKYGRPGIGPRGENFIYVRYIPARYDLPKYKLKADVAKSSDKSLNRFDFKLTTKP